LRNLGISRGEGALALEFPGDRYNNFQISRGRSGGGTLTLEFPGEGCINPGISREFPGKGASRLCNSKGRSNSYIIP
jgi:hypothetical protein